MVTTPEQRADILRRTTDIMNMSLCLHEKINSNAGMSNGISAAQEQILDLNDQIRDEESNSAIAKDRVSYIRNPEQRVSNYESWFPIDRPIHTFSLLVIMSISLFVGIFSLLMLCSLLGVDVMLYTEPTQTYTSGMLYSVYSQITPVTLIILAVLVGVLAYFLNRS